MGRFILRRFLQSLLTVFGVLTATFFLVRLSGDPASLLLPMEATDDDIARLRAELGLDQSLFIQYAKFLGNAAVGDFGRSLRQHVSAFDLVLERMPATLELALSAFVLGLVLAFTLGILMQLAGNRQLKALIMWTAFVRQAIPVFLFGLLLILIFSVTLGWLPSLGRGSFQNLILPALTLATYEIALYLRLFNAALGQELGQDYVRTANAKGQSSARILLGHIVPNALLPIVTIAGINLGALLGGAIVTETVFGWPGVGRLIVQAVVQRDYPVVIAGVFVVSCTFVIVNLIVDLLYSLLDPRVRLA